MHKTIDTVDCMRYDTVGDYLDHDTITVINLGDRKIEFCVALHELVESFLCEVRGVTTKQVDDFDFQFSGNTDPGDEMDAPYRKEHEFATKIERMMCEELGMKWHEYDYFLNNFTVKVKEQHHGNRTLEKDTPGG